MDVTDLGLLWAAVVLGFSIQTALGFGGGIVALSLGALWMPVQTAVPLIAPLSIVQSLAVLRHEHGHIAWRPLLRIIAPTLGTGFVVGLLLATRLAEHDALLRKIYGGLVIVLALAGLGTSWRSTAAQAVADGSPPQRVAASLASLVAGVVHGLFATGGPPLAWAAHFLGLRRDAFRTTLLATFLAINTVMVVVLVADARLRSAQALPLAMLVIAGLVAVPVGRWLARQLPEAWFRRAVYGLLLLIGLLLLR
jgi:uncharacterized protein